MNVVNFGLPSRPYFRRKLADVAASQSYLARDLPYVKHKGGCNPYHELNRQVKKHTDVW
jgi:hypothetical protein